MVRDPSRHGLHARTGAPRPGRVALGLALLTVTLAVLVSPRGAVADAALVSRSDDAVVLDWTVGSGPPDAVERVALAPGRRARVESVVADRGLEIAPGAVRVGREGWFRRFRFAELSLDRSLVPDGTSTVRVVIRLDPTETATAGPVGVDDPVGLGAPVPAPVDRAAPIRTGSPAAPRVGPSGGLARGELELASRLFVDGAAAEDELRAVAADRAAWPRPTAAVSGAPLYRARPAGAGGARLQSLEGGRVKLVVDRGWPDRGGDRGRQDRDAIYRVAFDDLAAAGIDLTGTDPDTLRLTRWTTVFEAEREDRLRPVEVPMRVRAADPSRFAPGDWVEFFGEAHVLPEEEAPFLDFDDRGVYFLDAGPCETTCRTVERPAAPVSAEVATDALATSRLEVNNWFLANHRTGVEADHFYWCPSLGTRIGVTERTEDVPLPGLMAASPRAAEVRVQLLSRPRQSAPSPDHESVVEVGGVEVSRLQADDNALVDHVAAGLSPATLADPAPVLVALPDLLGVDERAELNRIEIDYPRALRAHEDQLVFEHEGGMRARVEGFGSTADVAVLDVTDSWSPVRLTGVLTDGAAVEFELNDAPGRYAVAAFGSGAPVAPLEISWVPDTGLRDPANTADLVVVGPAAWLEADPPLPGLDEYVAHRAAQGLEVRLVTTEALRDEFGGGRHTPFALPFFLAHAITSWSVPPLHVLLVGDTDVDYQGELGGVVRLPTECLPDPRCGPGFNETESVQHVPTRFFDRPSDETFLAHFASDSVATLVVGGDDVPDALLGRLPVRSGDELEAVLRKIVAYEELAASPPAWADDVVMVADTVDPTRPSERFFETSQDDAHADHLVPYYERRAYYHDSYPSPEQLHDDLVADWSGAPGAAVVTYVGHGNPWVWSDDGLIASRNLTACEDDTDLLDGAPTPIVLNVGCITGAFANPNHSALLEELVRKPAGGAIAAFGPTGLTDASAAPNIVDPFYGAIHGPGGRDPERTLGEVVFEIQFRLGGGLLSDELYGNTLLGDPALRLPVPFGPPAVDLTATPRDGAVDLTWPPVDGAASYVLHRSDSGPGGPWTRIDAGTGTAWPDEGLVNGVLHHYALEPVDGDGYPGRWSPVREARPCSEAAPAAPTDLNAGDLGPGQVLLTWSPNPDPEVRRQWLRVRRGGTAGGFGRPQELSPSGGFQVVDGLVACRTYAFEVTAETWCGVEGPGAVVEHAIGPCPVESDPPDRIRDLRVRRGGAAGENLLLTWSPVDRTLLGGAVVPPMTYATHEETDPTFAPGPATEIDRQAGTDLTLPGAGAPEFPGDPEPRLKVFLVAAESGDGAVSPVGHELPQGVGGWMHDEGSGELDWEPVRHDVAGDLTAIARYHVFGGADPLDRAAVEGMAPLATVAEPPAAVPPRAEYFVLAEDVHGNLGAW